MSEDLLRKLRLLEDEYPGQPVIGQQADLREINDIRTRLGMPLVDARLNAIGVAVAERPKPEPVPVPDHTKAREIYRAYLEKVRDLDVHRAYAEQVARATAGPGQTPVRPLATMGTDGGPLLCEHCGKPMVLEGMPFHGVVADAAWVQNPVDGWTSWILGGMVVELQTNGTLRIYHGYPGRNRNDCCNVASRKDKKAREQFASRKRAWDSAPILALIRDEFPDRTTEDHRNLLSKIRDTLFSYDPGIGINRPGGGAGVPVRTRRRRNNTPR